MKYTALPLKRKAGIFFDHLLHEDDVLEDLFAVRKRDLGCYLLRERLLEVFVPERARLRNYLIRRRFALLEHRLDGLQKPADRIALESLH